jgi:hypothetical protein
MIAEECLGKIHPSLLPLDEEGLPVTIAYERLTCLLINEIQDLRKRVKSLESL